MQHKYVRFKNYGFVLWPMTHDVYHSHIGRMFGLEIVSAGFADLDGNETKCYGRSESLGVDSVSRDTIELKKQLGIN